MTGTDFRPWHSGFRPWQFCVLFLHHQVIAEDTSMMYAWMNKEHLTLNVHCTFPGLCRYLTNGTIFFRPWRSPDSVRDAPISYFVFSDVVVIFKYCMGLCSRQTYSSVLMYGQIFPSVVLIKNAFRKIAPKSQILSIPSVTHTFFNLMHHLVTMAT